MTATIISVPCLMIPVEGEMVLLPNAAVAEIVGYQDPEPVENAPDWLLGLTSWRGYKLPLVSYEAVSGKSPSPITGVVRIVIVNTLRGSKDVPYFGIISSGIPKLTHTNQKVVIKSAEGTTDSRTGVLQNVLVHGEPAVIPDLDGLEDILSELPKECLGGFYGDTDVEPKKKEKDIESSVDNVAKKKIAKKKVSKKKVVKKKSAKK